MAEKFTQHTGLVVPLDAANVDTDAIIPKQFLQKVTRTGFGAHLFNDWRFLDDKGQQPNPEFVLNFPEYKGASILLARENFGCGSSREHAPWALTDLGLRAVVSSEIADIFRSNALKNGLLPIVLEDAVVDELLAQPGIQLRIDIAARTLALPDGRSFAFPLDAFAQTCLLEGVDQLGYLLKQQPAIHLFETTRIEAARDAARAA